MEGKILVSTTLDGWTVTKVTHIGTFIRKTSPAIHGKLTKREAVEIARMIGKSEGLPVSVES